MKHNFFIVLCAVFTLACGTVSTLSAPAKISASLPTAAKQGAVSAAVWRVNCATLNVRSAAGKSSPVIGKALVYGSLVVIISAPHTTPDGAWWVKVSSAENGGIVGWVNVRYLRAQ